MDHTSNQGRSASCIGEMEEALNCYVDGELAFQRQAALFAHLSRCEHCRRTLDALMHFRRIGRQEHLDVPPAADDAFFKRLARHKATSARVDRVADRRPLWQRRTPVSLGAAVAVAVLLFVTGVLVPVQEVVYRVQPIIEGQQERVEFAEPVRYRHEMVYVFYPGLTVEAVKAEELQPPGPL